MKLLPLETNLNLMFGPYKVHPNQIFMLTEYSFATVNLKPIIAGHVLVCPIRPIPEFKNLSKNEHEDLFETVQLIMKRVSQDLTLTC